jgi:hypothetical protein
MSSRSIVLMLATLVGAPAARADRKDGALHRTTVDLSAYAWALGIMTDGKWDPGRPPPDPAGCEAAIHWAREHGLEDTDVLRDPSFEHAPNGRRSGNYHYEINLGEAAALCSAYATASRTFRLQAEAGKALEPFAATLLWMANVAPGEGGRDAVSRLEKAAAECPAAVDKAVAAGAHLDGKVVVRDVEKTLEKARKDICDGLAAKVPDYLARHKEAVRARREQTLAPYKAAGMGGDKLELMIAYDGVYWRGVGGDVVSDPTKLARATVLFHWLEDAQGTHTIRRYQFSGNKLVKKSEKTYFKRPGSDAFR